jgi:hypothetical protein
VISALSLYWINQSGGTDLGIGPLDVDPSVSLVVVGARVVVGRLMGHAEGLATFAREGYQGDLLPTLGAARLLDFVFFVFVFFDFVFVNVLRRRRRIIHQSLQ